MSRLDRNAADLTRNRRNAQRASTQPRLTACGSSTLVAGGATVTTDAITADSIVLLTAQAAGGTPGALRVGTRVSGTSFSIVSASGTDTSEVGWAIVEPSP